MTTTPAPVSTTPQPAETSAWTLLFYVDADNDLEESELGDLRQMLQMGSSKEVQLVALVDRSSLGKEAEGHTDDPIANQKNWSTAKLFHVEKDKLEILEDWGEVNMADSETLARFLKRARALYPSQKSALFLLDHGEAWAGICADDSAENPQDLLSPVELSRALGDTPVPLLVMDACLMGNLEAALALQGKVEWLVASEEIIPLSGLNYREVLTSLLAQPDANPAQLGQWVVQSYLRGLQEPDNRGLTHLALIRVGALKSLRTSLEALAVKVQGQLQGAAAHANWLKLARARVRSEEYGRSETPMEPSAEVRDLGHLSERLEEAFPALAPECRQLRRDLKQCIRTQVRGTDRPHARGLNIFFPPQSEWMRELASADYVELEHSVLPAWTKLLKSFTLMEREQIARPTLAPVAASATSWGPGEVVQYRSRLARPQDIDTCYFILAKDQEILGQLPSYPSDDSTFLEDGFDGRWLALTQSGAPDSPSILCPLSDSRSEPGIGRANPDSEIAAAVPAQLQRAGRDNWAEITLYVILDVSSEEMRGRVSSLVRHTSRGPVPVQLHSQDRIRLLHGSLQEGGHPKPGASLLVDEPEKLSLQMVDVASGSYQAGFQITDLQEHKTIRTVPLEVHSRK